MSTSLSSSQGSRCLQPTSSLMTQPFPDVPVPDAASKTGILPNRPLSTEQLRRYIEEAAYHRSEKDPLPPLQPPAQQPNASFQSFSERQPEESQENVLSSEEVLEMLADMRKVPPALRLVKDALANYHRSSKLHTKSLDRERLHRARKCLYPTPELSQAEPLPSKEPRALSSRSTTAGPSATPRLLHSPRSSSSRPATTGHPSPSVWPQVSHGRPRTSPAPTVPAIQPPHLADAGGPRLVPAVPSRRAGGSLLSMASRRSSMESLLDVMHTQSQAKHKSSRRVASRLAMLAGRLHHKVYQLQAKKANACELARSCRRRLASTRAQRQEEKNIAAAAIHSRQLEEWGPSPTMSGPVRRLRTGVVTEGDKAKREEAAAATEEKVQEPEVSSKKSRDEASSPVREAFSSFKAHSMSMDYNLPGGHVTQAWKLFKHYDANDDDLLSPYEFQLLLRTVLRDRYPRAKDVPRELFKEAIDIQHTHISVTFEDFLTWITRNAFQECLLLSDEQRFIRLVARRFYVSVPDVEKVKRRFDSFCKANPGHLEYQEFCQLIALLLNLRDTTALPESRVKSFWRELDDDCRGTVQFTDFIPWYLGYFGGDDGSSLVNFYRRIRPTVFEEEYT